MSNAYIVIGSTGQYSDHTYWHVAVYDSEEKAQEHARLANEEAKRIEKKRNEGPGDFGYWGEFKKENPNPYDPDMTMDYTGTEYLVVEADYNPVLKP